MRIIPGNTAYGLMKKNRAFRWAQHKPDNPIAASRTRQAVFLPVLSPKFHLKREDHIFTMGSCFARHVESHLERFGYRFATRDADGFVEPDECTSPNGFHNKFTTPSMLNEMTWAIGGKAFPEGAYYSDEGGRFYDGQMPATFATLERAKQVRGTSSKITRSVADCDVAIFTLGLVEAWYDNEVNLYLNVAPNPSVLRKYPGRFDVHVLDYRANLDFLNEMYELLIATRPGVKIVVTVSPVPLGSTFTGQDIAIANNYSKSVLRAVAGDFSADKSVVDYFPSYEAVTESTPLGAWMDDAVHVRNELVGCVIGHFMKNYLETEAAQSINLDKTIEHFLSKLPEWTHPEGFSSAAE